MEKNFISKLKEKIKNSKLAHFIPKLKEKLSNFTSGLKEKIKNSKIAHFIPELREKITKSKIFSAINKFFNSKVNENSNNLNDLKSKYESNVFSIFIKDTYGRFDSYIKRFKKKFERWTCEKDTIFKKIIKVICIIITIAFAALVIYCIKDVFVQVLLTIAMIAAVAVSAEIIMTILSIATGYNI